MFKKNVWVCLVLLSTALLMSFPVTGGASDFQELSDQFFLDRSADFAQELILKEQTLTVLYQSVVAELKSRRLECSTAEVVNFDIPQFESDPFDLNDPAYEHKPLAERYRLWMDFEENEFQQRSQDVNQIRQALIQSASSAQKLRMFRYELQQALTFYSRQEWKIASLLLDHLLNDYSYRTVDDILFYQGEACLQLGYEVVALDYLMQILNGYPKSSFRPQAYQRAALIHHNLGSERSLLLLYNIYIQEGMPGDENVQGEMHLRAAQVEATSNNPENAIQCLQRTPPESSYYLPARYLMADCHITLQQWEPAAEVLKGILAGDWKGLVCKNWSALLEEARLKLALIYSETGDYDQAKAVLAEFKTNSPLYDRVMLGKAWIAYRLDRHEKAVRQLAELLRCYPHSPEIYEASSLLGHCYNELGDQDAALDYFMQVLEAGVSQASLKDYQKEKFINQQLRSNVVSLEEPIFLSQDEELFQRYRTIRNLLEINARRLQLAELVEVNSFMREIVTERARLAKLLDEHAELESDLISMENAALISDFMQLENRILNIMEQLNQVGLEQSENVPLYYHEAQTEYRNSLANEINKQFNAEIYRLTASQTATQAILRQGIGEIEQDARLKIQNQLDDVHRMLLESYARQSEIQNARRQTMTSRLERWSNFSFMRYAMSGRSFDDLDKKYERIRKLDDYISALDEIIARRKVQDQPNDKDSSLSSENTVKSEAKKSE
ncbi:MAG: tetratricopeptide repeat protein [bacterium]